MPRKWLKLNQIIPKLISDVLRPLWVLVTSIRLRIICNKPKPLILKIKILIRNWLISNKRLSNNRKRRRLFGESSSSKNIMKNRLLLPMFQMTIQTLVIHTFS